MVPREAAPPPEEGPAHRLGGFCEWNVFPYIQLAHHAFREGIPRYLVDRAPVTKSLYFYHQIGLTPYQVVSIQVIVFRYLLLEQNGSNLVEFALGREPHTAPVGDFGLLPFYVSQVPMQFELG